MSYIERGSESASIAVQAVLVSILMAGILVLFPGNGFAQCNAMDGPVVQDAKRSLEEENPVYVLRWVEPEYESAVREAYQQTVTVRAKGSDVRELADRYFYETAVRYHLAGEGQPFTGLLPSGAEPDPVAQAVRKMVKNGSMAEMQKKSTATLTKELETRFQRVLETRKNAEKSVEDGREYVEAFSDFAHYVRAVHQAIHAGNNGADSH